MTSTITPATQPTARFTLGELAAKVTGNYLLRQLVKAIFTIWLVSTITFFVIRAMPGNAVDIDVNEGKYTPFFAADWEIQLFQ